MQITNTIGHDYEIVDWVTTKDPIMGFINRVVYRAADVKTGQIVGYIGLGQFGDISVYGPLAKEPGAAYRLAQSCALNRYNAREWHSNTR